MSERSILAIAIGAIVPLATLVATSAPASASDALACSKNQHKMFADASGNVTVDLQTCVERYGSTRKAAVAHVQIRTTAFENPPNLAATFKVTTRLEKHDAIRSSHACDWRKYGNSLGTHLPASCAAPPLTGASAGGWTADGVVVFHFTGSGHSTQTWNLVGSPEIS